MTNILLRAIKGGVLICRREERKGRVRISIASVPSVSVEGNSIDAAEELLLNKLWKVCELDEPIAFRYDDAVAETESRGSTIVQIGANEVIDSTDPARFFENGFCPTCQAGLGRRNAEPLHLGRSPSAALPGFRVRFQPYLRCGLRVGMLVLNSKLCQLIGASNSSQLELRNVFVKGKRVPGFLEVVPKLVISCVVPSARKAAAGGKCATCGAEFIYHDAAGKFVSSSSANAIRQYGAACVDSHSTPALCVTAKVWDKMSGTKAGQGLLSYPITELADEQISFHPKLEKLSRFKP